jgi:hypothetical protein
VRPLRAGDLGLAPFGRFDEIFFHHRSLRVARPGGTHPHPLIHFANGYSGVRRPPGRRLCDQSTEYRGEMAKKILSEHATMILAWSVAVSGTAISS